MKTDILIIMLALYVAVTMIWSVFVVVQLDYTASEKYSLAIFWPLYLLIWLCISVPKMLFNFMIKEIEK